MSYVRFMNANNPVWDFIQEMGGQQNRDQFDRRQHRPSHPWGWSPFDEGANDNGPWTREMPQRPHRPTAGQHPQPAPSTEQAGPSNPPEYSRNEKSATVQAEDTPITMVNNEEGNAPDPEISTPGDNNEASGDEHHRHGCRGRRSWHGHHHGGPPFGGRRGAFGHHGRGGMRGRHWGHGPGPWGFPYPHHRPDASPHHRHHRRNGSNPASPDAGHSFGPFAPFAEMFGINSANFDPERLREAFADVMQNAARAVHPEGARDRAQNINNATTNENGAQDIDFRPSADIYDKEDEYVVHFALPGAKKDDISLNWDAEKSELNVAGVIMREGDEEALKTLALDEREVGVFERKVKLGREPVEADGISAKMDNGLLVVRVPKRVEDEWTEVKKVDIE